MTCYYGLLLWYEHSFTFCDTSIIKHHRLKHILKHINKLLIFSVIFGLAKTHEMNSIINVSQYCCLCAWVDNSKVTKFYPIFVLVDSIHCKKGSQQTRIHTHTLNSLPTRPVNNKTYFDMSPRSSLGSPSLYNASKNIDLQDDQPHLGTGQ